MIYISDTLKAAQAVDAQINPSVDAAILKVKAETNAPALRPDQIMDGVQAVAEVVKQYGTQTFDAREIGRMIGYTEEFVKKVILEFGAEDETKISTVKDPVDVFIK